MGFMEKVKNLFTEEEEVIVEPVKKEVIQVEIPAPTDETKIASREMVATAVEPEKKDEKFSFPVFFDDKDFESLDKPKKEKKQLKNSNIVKKEDAYHAKGTKVEEKKIFRPSPIISPVYGILDKNYKKDDISNKKLYTDEMYHKPHKMNIDDVRNKAFGTLEDEIDTAFTEEEVVTMSRETFVEPTTDLEEDLLGGLEYEEDMATDHSPLDILDQPEEENTTSDFDMLDDGPLDENMVEESMEKEDTLSEDDLNLNESDLFNLIDSMYEKRDEEE